MSHSKLPFYALLLALSTGVSAEIYESEDAQGNSVFSDVPGPGAEEVELPESNIADAPPEMPATISRPASADKGGPNITVIPNSHNDEVDAAIREGKRVDVRDAEKRREVLEAEPRKEVLEAEPRREVRNAEPRHIVDPEDH